MDTRISIIAAVAKNGVIGRSGDLPWRLLSDLKRFRQLTTGRTLIVGRKTHEAIRRRIGGPLPHRRTIVMTRQTDYLDAACPVVTSLDEALKLAEGEEEVFVIGGGEIYRIALPLAEKIYLTRVHTVVQGDTKFPDYDQSEWHLITSERYSRDQDNEYDYTFEVWERRRS